MPNSHSQLVCRLNNYSTLKKSNDFTVQGSSLSLHATPAANRSRADRVLSVADLCKTANNADGTFTQLMDSFGNTAPKPRGASASAAQRELRKNLKMDDQAYVVPTFSWKKPKYHEARDKKLDYIMVFSDKKSESSENLKKVFLKKKHVVPGPEVYDMVKNWVKKSPYDYES